MMTNNMNQFDLALIKKYYRGINLSEFTPDHLWLKLEMIKRQQEILSLLNADPDIQRDLFDIKHPQKLVKVTDNALIWREDKNFRGKFFVARPVVAETLLPIFDKIDYALEARKYTQEILDSPLKSFLHFANLERTNLPQVFLTQANFTVGTGDGGCQGGPNATWATLRSAATSGAVDYASTNGTLIAVSLIGGNYYLWRGYLPVDTSGIGAGQVVSASNPNIYVNSKTDIDGESLVFILTTQANTGSIVVADYSALTLNSPAEGATRKTLASLNTAAYNTLAGNATGAGWVNITGWTKGGVRGARDVDNSAPTDENACSINFADNASNKPYYDITYAPLAGAQGMPFMIY